MFSDKKINLKTKSIKTQGNQVIIAAIKNHPLHRFLALACIIFAGEMIFSLPFHVARFFRPTMLEVFDITNTQLGDVFAAYGIVAMLAYFPGGAIADHWSYRKLMTTSLFATAAGGIYFYQVPDITGLFIVFGFWGLTSILLFWAAMIKATRDWAGAESQGLAFGLLDGGRGLFASLFATIAVFIFSQIFIPEVGDAASKTAGIQSVILFYSISTAAAGLFCWVLLNDPEETKPFKLPAIGKDMKQVASCSKIWLQGGIVIAAYCGYKGLDNYGIYAVQVLGMNDVEAAQFTASASYIRPIAAVAAGLVADRWRSSKLIMTLFASLVVVFMILNWSNPASMTQSLIIANVLLTFFAVYALRGIYFTLLEETKLNAGITGTAVGIISVVGYTPDIFFAPLSGRILDAAPGLEGFQNYFLLLAGISFAGLLCATLLTKKISQAQPKPTEVNA